MGQDLFSAAGPSAQAADVHHEVKAEVARGSSSLPLGALGPPPDEAFYTPKSSASDRGSPASASDNGSPASRIIVFDWDDTLMCSTAVKTGTPRELERLAELEEAGAKLLEEAQGHGEVMIITNGKERWVEESARRHLPGLLPTISKIRCVSARHMFERQYPGDPFMWKQAAFHKLLAESRNEPDAALNLVSIGDQMPEIQAARFVAKSLGPCCRCKTVKLKEQPTVDELIGQLGKLRLELDQIAGVEQSCGYTIARAETAGKTADEVAGWRMSPQGRAAPVATPQKAAGARVALRNVWPLLS
mmetsp:Transcript_72167/g.209014  ORF Transcript_72167/g.209014 Transcript_72167/m.209014 type:complete len:303 (+) Transcript_72167:59-967(+)